jgi:hypothetical protein
VNTSEIAAITSGALSLAAGGTAAKGPGKAQQAFQRGLAALAAFCPSPSLVPFGFYSPGLPTASLVLRISIVGGRVCGRYGSADSSRGKRRGEWWGRSMTGLSEHC